MNILSRKEKFVGIMRGNIIATLILLVSMKSNAKEPCNNTFVTIPVNEANTTTDWRDAIIELQVAASSKEAYIKRLKSDMKIINQYLTTSFKDTIEDISNLLDPTLNSKIVELKKKLEEARKYGKHFSDRQIVEQFLFLGKAGNKFVNQLDSFKDYFIYDEFLMRSLVKRIQQEADAWFLSKRSDAVQKNQHVSNIIKCDQNFTMYKKQLKVEQCMLNDFQKYKMVVDQCYENMKASAISNGFLVNLQKNVIGFVDGVKVDSGSFNIEEMKIYVKNMTDADDHSTDIMNKELIKNFVKILSSSNCLIKKLRLIVRFLDDCKLGVNNFDKLFLALKKQENNFDKKCLQEKLLSKDTLIKVVSKVMPLRNAQNECIRNNLNKKALVCSAWNNGATILNIVSAIDGVSHRDVKYFILKCPAGTVTSKIGEIICNNKNEGKSINNVFASFNRLNKTQIEDSYNNCNISTYHKKKICELKNAYHSLGQVRAQYPYFSLEVIKRIYDHCPKDDLTPNDKKSICLYKQYNLAIDDPSKAGIWNMFFDKYGKEKVESYYHSCQSRK